MKTRCLGEIAQVSFADSDEGYNVHDNLCTKFGSLV
jgi:hypothetical protein